MFLITSDFRRNVMSKRKAIILGFFTVLPFVYFILFLSFFIFSFISMSSNTGNPVDMFKLILPLHLSTMLLIMVLMIIYIIDVFKNNAINSDKKALWAIVLFFGNMIAMPIYWYLNIWKVIQIKES